uniref:Uncharacterized protein n=1 Tax=Vespula pensylvanica TaxID=30213 RepID=A0A834UGN0_VESPE|nr:hypothetical protein H0235_001026 [Vespula pensylvanica]
MLQEQQDLTKIHRDSRASRFRLGRRLEDGERLAESETGWGWGIANAIGSFIIRLINYREAETRFVCGRPPLAVRDLVRTRTRVSGVKHQKFEIGFVRNLELYLSNASYLIPRYLDHVRFNSRVRVSKWKGFSKWTLPNFDILSIKLPFLGDGIAGINKLHPIRNNKEDRRQHICLPLTSNKASLRFDAFGKETRRVYGQRSAECTCTDREISKGRNGVCGRLKKDHASLEHQSWFIPTRRSDVPRRYAKTIDDTLTLTRIRCVGSDSDSWLSQHSCICRGIAMEHPGEA